MNDDEAGHALRMVYEAVLLPDLWPQALRSSSRNKSVDRRFGPLGRCTWLGGISSLGAEEIAKEFVRQGWDQGNARMVRLTRLGFRALVTEQMISSEILARDTFEQEFAPRFGLEFEAAQVVSSHAGAHFILAFNRGRSAGPYSQTELASMNRLAEFFSVACSFALRLKLATTSQIHA